MNNNHKHLLHNQHLLQAQQLVEMICYPERKTLKVNNDDDESDDDDYDHEEEQRKKVTKILQVRFTRVCIFFECLVNASQIFEISQTRKIKYLYFIAISETYYYTCLEILKR